MHEIGDRAEASIITTIATMTAATITGMWSAMPTAVITLSSEKITSSSMIWTITARSRAALALARFLSLRLLAALDLVEISVVAFQIRNRPPPNRTTSRQEARNRRR